MNYFGKSVFEDRLKDIYRYSIINYLYGTGTISNSKGLKTLVNWELCVDLNGKLLFIMCGELASHAMNVDHRYIEYSLAGNTVDKQWQIKFEKMIICSRKYDADIGADVCQCEIQNDGYILIEKTDSIIDSIALVKAYLNNFYFKGLEAELVQKSIEYNKFSCKVDQYNACFKMLDNSKEVKKLISEKRIQSAIFSCVEIAREPAYVVTDIETEIDSITWFLSCMTFNTTFAPVYEYFDASGNLVKTKIKDKRTMLYQNLSLFDNQNPETRYPLVFDKSYNTFKALRVDLALDEVISLLLETRSQCTIEVMLATLIMAYELLLKKILLHFKVTESEMMEWNIQQKISQTNKFMKFIPAKLLGNDLRAGIRNPLFHQGDIPEMCMDEKYNLYMEYLNLFVRIILRMVKYDGKFIARASGYPVTDV